MLKWALIGLLAVAVIVVGSILALPWLLDTPAIQAYIQQAAGHALGRPVKFDSLSITALPLPTVRLRGLQVAEDPAFGSAPRVSLLQGGRPPIEILGCQNLYLELAPGDRIALADAGPSDAAGTYKLDLQGQLR